MTKEQIEKYNILNEVKQDLESALQSWKYDSEYNVGLVKWDSYSCDFGGFTIYTRDDTEFNKELNNFVYEYLNKKLEEVNKEIELL